MNPNSQTSVETWQSSAELQRKLDYARRLTDYGFRLLLVKPRDKTPKETGWQAKATSDFGAFSATLIANPACNVGIATGVESGIIALDIDPRHGGDESLAALTAEHGALPATLTVRTGGGGRHYIYRLPPDSVAKNSASKIAAGVDTRGDGGQIVAPGSMHECGGIYEIEAYPPNDIIPVAPVWLIAASGAERGKKMSRRLPSEIKAGQRNDFLTSRAGKLRRRGDSGERIATVLHGVNSKLAEPLDAAEVDGIAYGIERYEPELAEAFTDLKLAEAFARWAENTLVRLAEGGWAYYGEGRWRNDPSGKAELKAQDFVEQFVSALEEYMEPKIAQMKGGMENATSTGATAKAEALGKAIYKLEKAVKSCQSRPRIDAIRKLAASNDLLCASEATFDRDPNLFNVQNCTIDLRTGKPIDHDPGHRLKKQANVYYDERAECPRFQKFLKEILGDDGAPEFLQSVLGYALLANPTQKLAFTFLGTGNNGKSTLVELLHFILGDYAVELAPSAFLKKDKDRIRNDLARLPGARLVFTSEFNQGSIVDSEILKQIVSGGLDNLTVRQLYKEEFNFKCKATLFVQTNHPPVIDGGDSAMASRVCVIPFARRFLREEMDRELPAKLRAEASGVLNWFLEGLRAYQREGCKLAPPVSVQIATNEYLGDMDLVGRFLEQHCELDGSYRERSSDFLNRYRAFCAEQGVKPRTLPALKDSLKPRGITHKATNMANMWFGVKLRPLATTHRSSTAEEFNERLDKVLRPQQWVHA